MQRSKDFLGPLPVTDNQNMIGSAQTFIDSDAYQNEENEQPCFIIDHKVINETYQQKFALKNLPLHHGSRDLKIPASV